jgi:hypothetical protein
MNQQKDRQALIGMSMRKFLKLIHLSLLIKRAKLLSQGQNPNTQCCEILYLRQWISVRTANLALLQCVLCFACAEYSDFFHLKPFIEIGNKHAPLQIIQS